MQPLEQIDTDSASCALQFVWQLKHGEALNFIVAKAFTGRFCYIFANHLNESSLNEHLGSPRGASRAL